MNGNIVHPVTFDHRPALVCEPIDSLIEPSGYINQYEYNN